MSVTATMADGRSAHGLPQLRLGEGELEPQAISRLGEMLAPAAGVVRRVGGQQQHPGVPGAGHGLYRLLAHCQTAAPQAEPQQGENLLLSIRTSQFRLHGVVDLRRDGGLKGPLQGPGLPGLLQAGHIVAHIGAPAGLLAAEVQADRSPSGALTTRSRDFLSFISRQPTHCRWGIFFTFGMSQAAFLKN